MRKHVREGIVFEVGPRDHRFRGTIDFINLRHYVKIGTMPGIIVFKEWYKLEKGRKVSFRYEKDNKWLRGVIDEINENCIFLGLM